MTIRLALATAIIGATLSAATPAPARAQEMRPFLTLKSAKAIADGCEAMAIEKGWKMTIAVIGNDGNLILLRHMDGASYKTIDIARMKANTAAAFRMPSKRFGELSDKFPGLKYVPGLASWQGGEAIYSTAGAALGGVGASGARADQDAACGRAGIAAAGLKIAPAP